MTLNERLWAAGLLDAFDLAAGSQNRDALAAVLSAVAVEDPTTVADALLASPRFDDC